MSKLSSSSRRTWIENAYRNPDKCIQKVVLLAEDVDRNHPILAFPFACSRVVLLAEDVDRNQEPGYRIGRRPLSSSSRRTWIEM